jgi:hypothetical protein
MANSSIPPWQLRGGVPSKWRDCIEGGPHDERQRREQAEVLKRVCSGDPARGEAGTSVAKGCV